MTQSIWSDSETRFRSGDGLYPGKQICLEAILRSIRQENCVRVLGPRYRAKSQILKTAVDKLVAGGTHFAAYQSLKNLPMVSGDHYFASLYREVPLVNETDFFAGLYTTLLEKIDIKPRLAGQPPQTAFAFQSELLHLIRRSHRNIAIFIDDLETVPPNLVASLLGVLQTIYMTLIDEPGAHFQAVVCGSLSFSQLTLENASHFESISDLVLIPDLYAEDCEAMVKSICYQANIEYDAMTAPYLMAQTGGDANLITQILNISIFRMGNEDYKITPARLDEAIEQLLNQTPEQTIHETIEQIQSEANLLSCALRLMEQSYVASSQLPIPTNETPNPLDLCSAFTREGNQYRIKCDIWHQLLKKHLGSAQIGGWYAVAGYWQESISYLGQAVNEGNKEVRPELFAVIINAIHVSEEAKQAYKYLGDGLHAAYPNTTIRLYRREEQFLELLYFSEALQPNWKDIPLDDLNRPEVVALEGPDFSLATVENETYLFIPLRTGHARSHSIGLVVLGGLFTMSSPYQQRQDVLRFVEFLKQAARALLRAELLKKDKQRQLILDKVASITPKISEQLDLDAVYNAVLEQMLQHIPNADYGCIVELDNEKGVLKIVSGQSTYPVDVSVSHDHTSISINQRKGIASRAIQEKQSYLVNNISNDPHYLPAIKDTKSQLTVPIPIQERVSRALILESRQLNAFTPLDLNLLDMVAQHAGIAIQNARQFLSASNRQLRERTAMMATGLIHDINSAVAGIPDLVDELRYNLERNRDVSEPLKDLEKNALVTHRVSKRLRDFVVTGQHEVGLVELESLIRNAIAISENNRPPSVSIIPNMNGLNLHVLVDRLWIELLLKNLLTNAYESFEGREGVVTIDVGIDPNNIFIYVRDNGKGISPDIEADVFSLGFTTKNGRRMHGVGLFHCQMIAEAHGGQLTLRSIQGKETEFTLQLPRGQ